MFFFNVTESQLLLHKRAKRKLRSMSLKAFATLLFRFWQPSAQANWHLKRDRRKGSMEATLACSQSACYDMRSDRQVNEANILLSSFHCSSLYTQKFDLIGEPLTEQSTSFFLVKEEFHKQSKQRWLSSIYWSSIFQCHSISDPTKTILRCFDIEWECGFTFFSTFVVQQTKENCISDCKIFFGFSERESWESKRASECSSQFHETSLCLCFRRFAALN